MNNFMIVGGIFDSAGGKKSRIVDTMALRLGYNKINGGFIDDLYLFRPHNIDVLIWMPNIDNSEDKILPRLKVMNPKLLLISSKRVIEKKYSNYELVTRMIKSKSNLCLVIGKIGDSYSYSIIDPLGNVFSDTQILEITLNRLEDRISDLSKTVRAKTQQAEFDIFPESEPISDDFLDIVRSFGHRFSKLAQASYPERFMGNASTRCEYGFPSVRRYGHILVSKRNVNKEKMGKEDFVKTYVTPNGIFYVGWNKPSVDTPVQLSLYNHFNNINYITHGHCYIQNANFTKNKLPCGDLNEVKEILSIVKNKGTHFAAINLLGHGCLIMSSNLENFKGIKFESRPFPEY